MTRKANGAVPVDLETSLFVGAVRPRRQHNPVYVPVAAVACCVQSFSHPLVHKFKCISVLWSKRDMDQHTVTVRV
jgi:hypothetical protein